VTIDRSVLRAIFRREPGHAALLEAIAAAEAVRLPAPALAFADMIVAAQTDPIGTMMLHNLVDKLHLTVVPFGEGHCHAAREVFEAGRWYRRPEAGTAPSPQQNLPLAGARNPAGFAYSTKAPTTRSTSSGATTRWRGIRT
jgi:uncharacterized protein with PIN domain